MADHKQEDNCDCGHDHEEEEGVFVVTDEDGNEHELVMVYAFEADNRGYAVLLDRNDPEADGFIFRIEEDGDSTYLVDIEDEAEWEKAAAIYNEIVEAQE